MHLDMLADENMTWMLNNMKTWFQFSAYHLSCVFKNLLNFECEEELKWSDYQYFHLFATAGNVYKLEIVHQWDTLHELSW